MNDDYSKYALGQLENWIHDTLSNQNISEHDIYDKIKDVAEENYLYHQQNAERLKNFLNILQNKNSDSVKRWILPVEKIIDEDEYYVTLPEDLLTAVGFKEDDQIEFVNQNNGSYLIRKVKEN